MTWNVPVKDNCPECGKTMFKLSGKGRNKPFCMNESCPNFLPEDKRGFKKKKTADAGSKEKKTAAAGDSGKKTAAKKSAAKKTTGGRTAAKKAAGT